MEPQIKDSLISLLDAIKRSDGTTVATEMEKLDGYLDRARAEGSLDPRLGHFLGNRSYAKALAFLGGDPALLRQGFGGQAATPPGGCSSHREKPAQS